MLVIPLGFTIGTPSYSFAVELYIQIAAQAFIARVVRGMMPQEALQAPPLTRAFASVGQGVIVFLQVIGVIFDKSEAGMIAL